MTSLRFLPAVLLALPLFAKAQTSSSAPAAAPAAPGTRQVTEVTEDLDPATGKVVRRTTRTYSVPAGQTASPADPSAAAPAPTPAATEAAVPVRATDAQVAAFLGRKTLALNSLSAPALLDTYGRFMEKVRTDRHKWRAADWAHASAVLAALNARYDELRAAFTLDDKLSIRSQQAEFQALRTARQLSDQVSNKL